MGILEKLIVANELRQVKWDENQEFDLVYYGNALAGEVGEACNIIKKLRRNELIKTGSTATMEDLADELSDVVIYAILTAKRAGIDLTKAIPKKFNKTSRKYGFDILMEE